MGTTVNAQRREAATAKLIVRIISLNSREIKPPSNKNGRIETRLVAVRPIKQILPLGCYSGQFLKNLAYFGFD